VTKKMSDDSTKEEPEFKVDVGRVPQEKATSDSEIEEMRPKVYTGILLPTMSMDVPYAIFQDHGESQLYLVPWGQLFKLPDEGRMTKARQQRFEWEFRVGMMVIFEPKDVNGASVATSVEMLRKPYEGTISTMLDRREVDRLIEEGEVKDGGVVVKDLIVIKPLSRECFSKRHGFINCPRQLSDSILADVVFNARVLVQVELEEVGMRDVSRLPSSKLVCTVLSLEVANERISEVKETLQKRVFSQRCPFFRPW